MSDTADKDWTAALLTEMRRFNPGGYNPVLAQHPGAVLGQDAEGVTPLMQAASTHDWLVPKIIYLGASAIATDKEGRSAMHHAAMSGYGFRQTVIKFLRDAGGDINATDNVKRTPLHYAVFANNTSALKTLLEAGADVSVRDAYGETPGQVAERLERGADFTEALSLKVVPFKARELTPRFNKASAPISGAGATIIVLEDYVRRLRALRGPHR